jgi:hypothetical protein
MAVEWSSTARSLSINAKQVRWSPVGIDHEQVRLNAEETLGRLRERFMIPPRWRIHLEIKCPDKMPEASGSMSWSYLPNAHYFLSLRCDVPAHLLEWIIAHELFEAIMAPYAELVQEHIERIPGKTAQRLLHNRHGDIRNEIIETIWRPLSSVL